MKDGIDQKGFYFGFRILCTSAVIEFDTCYYSYLSLFYTTKIQQRISYVWRLLD